MSHRHVLRDEVLHDVRRRRVAHRRIVIKKTLHWRRGVDLVRHVRIAFLRIGKGNVLSGASCRRIPCSYCRRMRQRIGPASRHAAAVRISGGRVTSSEDIIERAVLKHEKDYVFDICEWWGHENLRSRESTKVRT